MGFLKWYTLVLLGLGVVLSLREAVFGPDEKLITNRRTLQFWSFIIGLPALIYMILSL